MDQEEADRKKFEYMKFVDALNNGTVQMTGRSLIQGVIMAHGLTVGYTYFKAVFIDEAYTIIHPDLRYTDSR